MKKAIIFGSILLSLFFGITSIAFAGAKKKANKDTQKWRYDIEAAGVGTQGTYLVKVWSYSKKPSVAMEQSKKNAVHGVIFKGFVGKPGVPGQKALATSPAIEQEKQQFFEEFFADGGKYAKYVYESTSGAVAAEDRMKVGKEYKIGIVVSVNVDALRKDLEAAGVIKGLSSGF